MGSAESLSHTRWECKYHLVWIPKCRRKTLYGQLRKHLGEVLHDLAFQKESRILEGHLQADHVHMLVSIPPKYSVIIKMLILFGQIFLANSKNSTPLLSCKSKSHIMTSRHSYLRVSNPSFAFSTATV